MAKTPTDGEPPTTRDRRGYGGHADSLRADIKQMLLDLGLRPGDPIPSEAALIERLGVSRGSLREALKSLQALGIVETRHGSGTYVSSMSFDALADGMIFHSRLGGGDALSAIAELADIREVLETQLVRRVAVRSNAAQLERLDALLAAMAERVQGGGDLDELDRQFHTELYAGLNRRLVAQLLNAFWRALAAAKSVLPAAFMSGEEAVDKHRAIVEAVRSGDADEAARAMRAHFDGTRAWVGQIAD